MEMDYNFYLVYVKKASVEENEEATSSSSSTTPKFYLRPVIVLPFDSFTCIHGPFTAVDGKFE